MVGGALLIVLVFACVWLTFENALQFCIPWAVAVLIASILLGVTVKLARKSVATQKVIACIVIIPVVVGMAVYFPLHWTMIWCIALVGMTLFVAVAIAYNGPARDKVVKAASPQLLWLIPMALTFYTYSVNPGEVIVPLVVTLLGIIVTIPSAAI